MKMKRTSVIIIAAALMLSLSGCGESSESVKAEDIIPVSQGTVSGTVTSVSVSERVSEGSVTEICTSEVPETAEITGRKYSDFGFFAKAQDFDRETGTRSYYEGEITDDVCKQEIFDTLCGIFGQGELVLSGEQSVSGGAVPFLTMKSAEGTEFKLCKGILTYHPMEEGGDEVYILVTPYSRLCFAAAGAEFEKLIAKGVRTEENLVGQKVPENSEPDSVSPKLPLTFIQLRTNWAWGESISGYFFDSAGRMFTFDLSNSLENVPGQDLAETVCDRLEEGGAAVKPSELRADISALKTGLEYVAKIDPGANVREESVMFDYGQDTLYAVVDGKPVMLVSKGDINMTVEDENAENAIRCFSDAMQAAMPAQE